MIRINSGTPDVSTYKAYLATLSHLDTIALAADASAEKAKNQLQWLKDGTITMETLHAQVNTGKAKDIASPIDLDPISNAFTWTARTEDVANRTRTDIDHRFKTLLDGHPSATVKDLPTLLVNYRRKCERERTFVSFRLMRAAVLSFLEHHYNGTAQHIRTEILSIKPFPRKIIKERKPSRKAPSMKVQDVMAMLPKFSKKYQGVIWSLFTTGLRPTEYSGSEGTTIVVHQTKIEVKGHTKTEESIRYIPNLGGFVQHRVHDRSLGQVIAKATDGKYQPRDFRRAYHTLLEDVGIPSYRQRHYTGHKADDVHGKYADNQVDPEDLKNDRTKLKAYIGNQNVNVGANEFFDFK